MWASVSAGATLDDGLRAEFGYSLAELQAMYADFIEASSDPATRFAGTVLAE